MDDATLQCLFEANEKAFLAEIKRVDELRNRDNRAVEVARSDMKDRLEGFPQQFATKQDLQAVAAVVAKLDKDTLTRELYDDRHKALTDLVLELSRVKMDESVFDTFVQNYRIEQESAATERRAVAQGLATASAAKMGEGEGAEKTRKVLTYGFSIATAVITFVVLVANNIGPF